MWKSGDNTFTWRNKRQSIISISTGGGVTSYGSHSMRDEVAEDVIREAGF